MDNSAALQFSDSQTRVCLSRFVRLFLCVSFVLFLVPRFLFLRSSFSRFASFLFLCSSVYVYFYSRKKTEIRKKKKEKIKKLK